MCVVEATSSVCVCVLCTHSRYLVQWGGSDMAMKQQLHRMVNMMNRLNKVLTG